MLSTSDHGGAGRAAARLNDAVNELLESKLFVKNKTTNNNNIELLETKKIYNPLFSYINKRYFMENRYPGSTILSLMYSEMSLNCLEKLQKYEIVNFHWISQFISIEAMVALEKMGKGLVWTLHDQHPMTGNCHYAHGCNKYEIDCNKCPQMKENRYNFSYNFLRERISYIPKSLVVVSPSQWLADCAKKSAVFRNHRVEVIPNSLDLNVFQKHSKFVAKSFLGIGENKKVILFGAENHNELRKGFKELLASMYYLKNNTELAAWISAEKVIILLFGIVSREIEALGIPYLSMGHISDDYKLSMAYSAADIVALPSLEDNLPNVILEAMACGTPVVSFHTGGMPDFIIEGETGATVPLGNVVEFAEAISSVLLSKDLSFKCRKFAEAQFNYQKQAKQYTDIYVDLLHSIPHGNVIKKENNFQGMFPETAVALVPYIEKVLDQTNDFSEIEMKKFLYGDYFEEKIIDAVLENKLNFLSYKEKSVGIWGTGTFAKKLIQKLSDKNENNLKCICGFFDGKKKNTIGKIFDKYNLLQIEDMGKYLLKVIIIASLEYETEIYEEIKHFENLGIKIVKLMDVYQK